jgi:CspA family cold shock protein
MPYGTVKWFKDEKGFGIIGQDDGGEDLFVHFSDIDASGWRTLREGQRVLYEVILGLKRK